MIVKGNKVLASARKKLRRDGLTTKAQIKSALEAGKVACDKGMLQTLYSWVGMLPPAKEGTLTIRRPAPYVVASNSPSRNKKKTPVKKAVMKKGAATTKKAVPKKRATVKRSDNIQKRGQAPKPKNGGAGRGQGRKLGAATTKTRKIADDLAKSDDITPLEYMLQTLRETPEKIKAQYEAGDLDTIQYTLALSNLTARRDSAAKDAASYIHPRLSSIEANVGLKGQDLFAALLEKEEG